jgi:putative NADH-flavin reductase
VKLLVVGATGGTGKELVAQALARGHDMTVLIRDPRRLEHADPRLRVVVGSPTEGGNAVARAMRGQDVVISALGRGTSFRSDHLMARSMDTLVPAMESQGVRRLIVVSACGVGESGRDAPLLPRLLYRFLLKDIFADKQAGEDRVRRSALDWTFVYPVGLTSGPRTGRYRVGERLELRGIMPMIARANVADFILTQLDSPTYRQKTAIISD